MIEVARVDQARHEGYLAAGITSMMRGEDGPSAIAAGRILAETVIMWRAVLQSKFER